MKKLNQTETLLLSKIKDYEKELQKIKNKMELTKEEFENGELEKRPYTLRMGSMIEKEHYLQSTIYELNNICYSTNNSFYDNKLIDGEFLVNDLIEDLKSNKYVMENEDWEKIEDGVLFTLNCLKPILFLMSGGYDKRDDFENYSKRDYSDFPSWGQKIFERDYQKELKG